MKLFRLQALAFALLLGPLAHATPITYITSSYASGQIVSTLVASSATTFTDRFVTVSILGDTSDVLAFPQGISFYPKAGSITVLIAGLGTLTDLTSMPHFTLRSAAGNQAAYIDSVLNFATDQPYFFLTPNSTLLAWDGISSLGPLTLPNDAAARHTGIRTDGGTFLITSSASTGTFQAVLGSSAAVPERSRLLLLSTGAICLAATLRPRLA